MKLLFYMFITAGFIFTSCQNSDSEKKEFNISEVQAYIERMNKNYNERFKVNEVKITGQKYTKDAAIFPPNDNKIIGIPAITYYYYNEGKNLDLKVEFERVKVTGDQEMVVEEGEYILRGKLDQLLDKGKYLVLWKKENDSWKMWREIWNSSEPVEIEEDPKTTE